MGLGCGMRRQVEREIQEWERILLSLETRLSSDPSCSLEQLKARTGHTTLIERLRCLNYAAHSAKTHALAD